MDDAPTPSLRLRDGLAALLVAAAAFAVTFGVWRDLLRTALNDEESGHILLVPLVLLWLIWVRRGRLGTCRLSHRWVGTLVMAVGWLLWSWGHRSAMHTFWDAGAILAVVGVLISFLGTDILVKFLPAFLVLAFLIPVWPVRRQQLAWPLQLATAQATQAVCEVLGLDVVRHGNLLVSNGVNVEIAEACNGMRMVLTLALVSFAYVFVTPLRFYARALILAATPLTAVAANVIRLIPTVWVYGHASPEVAHKFHDVSGWVMLFVAFLLPAGFVGLLRWATVPVMATREESRRQRPMSGVAPSAARNPGLKWAPAISLMLLMGMGAERLTFHPPTDAAPYHARIRELALRIPLRIGRWSGEDVPVPYEAEDKLRANVLISRRYEDLVEGRNVSFLLVQCDDAALLAGHFPPTCYHNQGYVQLSGEPRDWVAGRLAITGMQYEFAQSDGGRPALVVANFLVMPDGRIVRDIDAVNASANDLRARYYGAAEFQIILDPDTGQDERDRIVSTFASACAEVIEAVESGPRPDPATKQFLVR